MSRKKLPYKVKNDLDKMIIKELGKRMAKNGIKINKSDIMLEIADFCNVGYENIRMINRNASQPSLAVAIMISRYFNMKVEDIFKIN